MIQEESNVYDTDDEKADRLESEQEKQARLRAERRSKIKLESMAMQRDELAISDSEYSFGMQCLFRQYDPDHFGCITFEGLMEALKLLELDDTPEHELRALYYFADANGN